MIKAIGTPVIALLWLTTLLPTLAAVALNAYAAVKGKGRARDVALIRFIAFLMFLASFPLFVFPFVIASRGWMVNSFPAMSSVSVGLVCYIGAMVLSWWAICRRPVMLKRTEKWML